jgi:hypothetical protein
MPILESKFAGKCRVCKTPHAVGDRVFWTKAVRGVTCMSCHASSSPAPSPNPWPAPSAPRKDIETPSPALPPSSGMIVREWKSWGEYVQFAKDSHGRDNNYFSASDRSRPDWHGTKSFEDAEKMALGGWQEIRPEVDALVHNIETTIMPTLGQAFTSCFDVAGGSVDIGRFLDGEPECMVETKLIDIAKPGKVVTVLVQGFYSSASDTKEIKARGAMVVALIDAIERMQHSTEIYVEYTYSKRICHLVKVKGAEDMLDIDTLMFILAHPSAYRRISFAAQEVEPGGLGCGPSGNYGKPNDLTQGERVGAAIKLDTLRFDTPTMDSKEWIREQLVNVGLVREEGE